jgi:hypothetical protein
MKTITIRGKEYKVKYTIRALFIFERIMDRAFEVKTLLDNYMFFYCMILANNPDDALVWDDFIDALDEDPTLYQAISDVVKESQERSTMLSGASDDTDEGTKKK